MSENLIAVILGIVEGLTEYVPVSSTGHLIISGHLLGFTGYKANTFEIFIQLGAILAVVLLYFRYFRGLFDFSLTSSISSPGFRGIQGLAKLAVGAFPVMLVGLFAHKFIKEVLFSPMIVGLGLFAGGVVMLLVDNPSCKKVKDDISAVSYLDCFVVGLVQCFALWPGVSRSGATIIGGLAVGFSRKLAAEFSFILAVPVMTVACVYDLYKNIGILNSSDIAFFFIGFLVSWIVAMIAIKFLMRVLQTWSFRPFAVYRILIGLLIVLLWK